MSGAARSTLVDRLSERARLAPLADGLAIAAAVTLPWSVTAASIAIVLWLLAVLPTLNWATLRRSFTIPAGALPVLLLLLAIVGVAWSEASPADQFGSIKIFARLVIIGVLFVQFQRSDAGSWVAGVPRVLRDAAGRVVALSGWFRRWLQAENLPVCRSRTTSCRAASF